MYSFLTPTRCGAGAKCDHLLQSLQFQFCSLACKEPQQGKPSSLNLPPMASYTFRN